MDKLPPPPPPPPPGRGRQHGPQPDQPSERRSGKPDGNRPPNFGEGERKPGSGGLRRWIPWVIAGAFIAVFFVPALMKGGDGDEMSYSDFMDLVIAGKVESVTVETGS